MQKNRGRTTRFRGRAFLDGSEHIRMPDKHGGGSVEPQPAETTSGADPERLKSKQMHLYSAGWSWARAAGKLALYVEAVM